MRLIDADALIDALGISDEDIYFEAILEDAPTVDAVPLEDYQSMEATCVKLQKAIADTPQVVRCKDCKCWTELDNGTGSCSRFALDWIGTDADDFCSMGERKDDE